MAISQEVVTAIFSGIGALFGGIVTLVGQRVQSAKDQQEIREKQAKDQQAALIAQRATDVQLFNENLKWATVLMQGFKDRLVIVEDEVKTLKAALNAELEKNRDCEDRYTTLEGQLSLVTMELSNIRRNQVNA